LQGNCRLDTTTVIGHYLTKNGLLASDSRDDFRGGALHCFYPRAPKTLVTPLLRWQRFASKVAFNLLQLRLAPPLRMTPFEFCQDFRQQKTKVHGYRVALFAWSCV